MKKDNLEIFKLEFKKNEIANLGMKSITGGRQTCPFNNGDDDQEFKTVP